MAALDTRDAPGQDLLSRGILVVPVQPDVLRAGRDLPLLAAGKRIGGSR